MLTLAVLRLQQFAEMQRSKFFRELAIASKLFDVAVILLRDALSSMLSIAIAIKSTDEVRTDHVLRFHVPTSIAEVRTAHALNSI